MGRYINQEQSVLVSTVCELKMSIHSGFHISISATGCVGAACVLMERDSRARGSRTPLGVAWRLEEPGRPGPQHQAAWDSFPFTRKRRSQHPLSNRRLQSLVEWVLKGVQTSDSFLLLLRERHKTICLFICMQIKSRSDMQQKYLNDEWWIKGLFYWSFYSKTSSWNMDRWIIVPHVPFPTCKPKVSEFTQMTTNIENDSDLEVGDFWVSNIKEHKYRLFFLIPKHSYLGLDLGFTFEFHT